MTEPNSAVTDDELQARKDEAEVRRIEADARKAAADAAKAEADADKAAADARALEAKIASDATTAEATARKVIAEADREAATARRAQLSALIPDLSTVKDSTLEVKDGPALQGTVLTFGALRGVAAIVASRIAASLPPGQQPVRLLLTADDDLASADAVFQDVATGLAQLVAAAQLLLDQTGDGGELEAFGAAGVVAAVAGAVPAVLSLLSSKRTLSSAAVTVSDLAATAAVAGALKESLQGKVSVVHDGFRLVPPRGVYEISTQLSSRRQELVGRRLALADQKRQTDSDLIEAKAKAKELETAIAKAGDKPDADQVKKLEALTARIQQLNHSSAGVGLRIGQIESLVASIDTFSTAIRVVPAGNRRSALATAALCEQLHAAAQSAERFTHVLVVKSQPGQSQQLIENRPLWFQDKFSTVVDVSVTYMLMETAESGILAAGTETTTVKAYGKIGDPPKIEIELPRKAGR